MRESTQPSTELTLSALLAGAMQHLALYIDDGGPRAAARAARLLEGLVDRAGQDVALGEAARQLAQAIERGGRQPISGARVAPSSVVASPAQARSVSTNDLFAGAREATVMHNGVPYRLSVTRQDKLILTK